MCLHVAAQDENIPTLVGSERAILVYWLRSKHRTKEPQKSVIEFRIDFRTSHSYAVG